MSLPFSAPPHVELVDDVLPVELINRAADRVVDAKALMRAEHMVGRNADGGKHDVVTVPIAQAIMQMPSDSGRLVVADTPTPVGTPFGFAGDVRWHPGIFAFIVRISRAFVVTGIETKVRASHGLYAFGVPTWVFDTPGDTVEYAISFKSPDGLTATPGAISGVEHVLINVYGVRR